MIEIVRGLNSRGIPGPKGKGWGKTSVYKILTNEVYTGTLVWGEKNKRGLEPISVENACEAIVDKETFLKVQESMRDRMPAKVHPRRAASPFLLSGLLFCGHCGKALIGRYAKNGKFSYYVCGTQDKKGAGACPARHLSTRKFEAIVIDQIKKHVLTPENLKELVEITNRELDSNMGTLQADLDTISHSMDDTNQRLGRLYDAIETGKIGLDDLADRIRDLRSQQGQLTARRLEIEAQMADRKVELVDLNMMNEYIRDMQEVLMAGSLAERRAFIRSFVQEIKVTGDEALLTYFPPIPPEMVEVEKETVPRTVHRGGQ
ncbi:MAG: recombinase family protein [Dehalococcoidales bacterium]|nr:recombinase family protein [Dehalococcoidales bacterium]